MAQSLAVKYRPKDFNEVLGQQSVIRILSKQLESGNISNCYLLCGPSGDGKTTIGRAFAYKVNKGKGTIIEIDGASNNGVEAVRAIIDECHMITTQGWNAFLKCIEEPPQYTIFIFCTTNPEKIPETILNRVMRFNLSKVDTRLIKQRLEYICNMEGFTNYFEACDFIAKLSNGGVRDAIATLEKCANFDTNLCIDNVLECLGTFSFDSLFNLTAALYNGDEAEVLTQINDYYNSGNDLKQFIEQYLDFSIDLTKYILFKDISMVKIPSSLEQRCKGYASIPCILQYSNKLVEDLLAIKNAIKYDVNSKTTVEAMFIAKCREVEYDSE